MFDRVLNALIGALLGAILTVIVIYILRAVGLPLAYQPWVVVVALISGLIAFRRGTAVV